MIVCLHQYSGHILKEQRCSDASLAEVFRDMMTKKDYEAVAGALRELTQDERDTEAFDRVTVMLANRLEAKDDNFDRDKFFRAVYKRTV